MTESERDAAAKLLAEFPQEKIDPPIKTMIDGQAYLAVTVIAMPGGMVLEVIDEAGNTEYVSGDQPAEIRAVN